MIDTIAYDEREKHNYENFFEIISSNLNPIGFENHKLEKEIIEQIKYEYTTEIDVQNSDVKKIHENQDKMSSERNIFSCVRTMAYVFVFDYFNKKSFDDIKYFSLKIAEFENGEMRKDSNYIPTEKAFICNKFPYDVRNTNDEDCDVSDVQIDNKKHYSQIYAHDDNAKYYLRELKEVFQYVNSGLDKVNLTSQEIEDKIKDNLFFVNTKWNVDVTYAFEKNFRKIYQNDGLWKQMKVEKKKKEESVKEEHNKETSKFFSCACFERSKHRSKNKKDISSETVILKSHEESEHNIPNLSEDEDQINMQIEPPDKKIIVEKEEEEEEEAKNSVVENKGCYLI